jgi:hypothetical protein
VRCEGRGWCEGVDVVRVLEVGGFDAVIREKSFRHTSNINCGLNTQVVESTERRNPDGLVAALQCQQVSASL